MEIGAGSASLLCITNKTDCCSDDGASGQWISPGGTPIPSSGSAVIQQYGLHSVRLENPRRSNQPDTGIIYLCNITGADNRSRHFYVGIYTNQGESKYNNMILGYSVISMIYSG